MKKILNILLNVSLKKILSFISLSFNKVNFHYTVRDIITSSKHMSSCSIIDRIERYYRVICSNNNLQLDSFEITKLRILEIGCGPVCGFAPYALLRNCKHYAIHDPNFNTELLSNELIINKYYKKFYSEFSINYNHRDIPSMSKYLNKIRDIDVVKDFMNNSDTYDLIISNSVFEHINCKSVESIIFKTYESLNKQGYFFHSIDFSPHNYKGSDNFNDFYKYSPSSKNNLINYLRLNDFEKFFKKYFYDVNVLVYRRDDVCVRDISTYWKKYSKSDLECRVAFIFGRKV